MSTETTAVPPNPRRVMDMACAFYESSVLLAAVELNVFDALARAGEATAEALATVGGLDPRGLRLLLDACAALGLVEKSGDVYRNGAEARCFLVPGAPGDLSGALRYNRDVYPAWGKLPELVRSGKPVEAPALHLGDDAERTRRFVLSMHGRALGMGRAVVPLVDLGRRQRLLDIGGGSGAYSMLLAEAHAGLQATVLDLPGIVAVSRELIAARGLRDRVTCLAGDYRTTPFPAGQDAVIIFGVLHQEEPASIRAILRRAHAALAAGGVIYIMDLMTDASRCHPRFSALFAVNMALTTDHGWVFAREELGDWLREAGFVDFACRELPPPMPHWLASARK